MAPVDDAYMMRARTRSLSDLLFILLRFSSLFVDEIAFRSQVFFMPSSSKIYTGGSVAAIVVVFVVATGAEFE